MDTNRAGLLLLLHLVDLLPDSNSHRIHPDVFMLAFIVRLLEGRSKAARPLTNFLLFARFTLDRNWPRVAASNAIKVSAARTLNTRGWPRKFRSTGQGNVLLVFSTRIEERRLFLFADGNEIRLPRLSFKLQVAGINDYNRSYREIGLATPRSRLSSFTTRSILVLRFSTRWYWIPDLSIFNGGFHDFETSDISHIELLRFSSRYGVVQLATYIWPIENHRSQLVIVWNLLYLPKPWKRITRKIISY